MLSVIIPAYNEEKTILPTLKEYYEYFNKSKIIFEIIIVADGCTDRTCEIADNFRKGKKNIRLISFDKRMGKGGGVIEGFRKARGDTIGFTDADNSTAPEEFEKIVKEIRGYDASIGSRAIKGSVQVVKQSVKRRLLGWMFRKYVNILFSLNIKDTQCGAKVFRKNVIKKILDEMEIKGFAFDVEMLYRLKKHGYRVKEVPIKWVNNENSTVKTGHVFNMLWTLLKLRL